MKKGNLLKCFLITFSILSFFLFLFLSKDSIDFFYEPSQAISKNNSKKIVIGGKILRNTIIKNSNGASFVIFDPKTNDAIQILYNGIVPFTFGNDVYAIISGKFSDCAYENSYETVEGKYHFHNKCFLAEKLLSKHNEYYRP